MIPHVPLVDLGWQHREIADEVGAITMADVSHIGGLIAGGVMRNPLDAGFDVMTTTGRSRATISSLVSITVKRISSSSRRMSFGNSRSALSTSSISSTCRSGAAKTRPRGPSLM